MGRDLVVVVEQRQGTVKRASLEAVSEARRLAEGMGGRTIALVPAASAPAGLEAVSKAGAARVLALVSEHLSSYSTEGWADAVVGPIGEVDPAAVLLSATAMGRDLAPRLAARLSAGLASDCTALSIEGGALMARRPVYSGKAVASVQFGGRAVITLRPNVFALAEYTPGSAAETRAVPLDPARIRARVARTESAGQKTLDVAEAGIVVSGGRGLKDPANFSLIRDLAEALGGAVGASRAVVDAGWIEHAHQVGQTGKVVAPALYVACGISGAIQHLAGMSTSRVIVAVNKDPEAPIFKIADYGIVGDVFEVLPAMTEAVRKLKAE